MRDHRYLMLSLACFVLAAILIVVSLSFCRISPLPPPDPTLSISATPSNTPLPPTATIAIATDTPFPPPSLTPSPIIVADATPLTTGTAVATIDIPTVTAVPPTITPLPTIAFYMVQHPIFDTLWVRAAKDCGDANLWGNLAAWNGIKNPYHMQRGDVVYLACEGR